MKGTSAVYVPLGVLLVNLTPWTYSATPRSTAHHGFVVMPVFAHDPANMFVLLLPSLALEAS